MSRQVVSLFGGPLDGVLARPKAESSPGAHLRIDGSMYRPTERRDNSGRQVYEFVPTPAVS